jgi:hypothetical protein
MAVLTAASSAASSGRRTAALGIRPCACSTPLMTVGLGPANSAADSGTSRLPSALARSGRSLRQAPASSA